MSGKEFAADLIWWLNQARGCGRGVVWLAWSGAHGVTRPTSRSYIDILIQVLSLEGTDGRMPDSAVPFGTRVAPDATRR